MSKTNLLVIIGILSAGLVALAILLILIRFVFDLRLTAIQREPDHSQLFRRKVNHLRKIEQARHIRYLLITCLMIGIGLAVMIGSFLVLVDNQQKMAAQNQKVHKRIAYLEKQQEQLMTSIPLKKYPKEGIGLKNYDWEKLAGEKKDLKLQKQIESDISKRSVQYFDSFDTKVSLANPKTISLQLKGYTDDDASRETIKNNLDDFAKEAENISELNNIHVRMITSVSKERQVVYSVNYSREKSEDTFQKQNVSEQNLKNSGAKG